MVSKNSSVNLGNLVASLTDTSNANDQTLLTNVTMNQTFVSAPILLIENNTYCFQAIWTGTPTGAFTLQASCDTATDPINTPPTNWTVISGSTINATGVAGNLIQSYQQNAVPYNWVQFVYTFTSGTGLLVSLRFNGK